ncbi:hypothetical protein BHM03_00045508 [Ensete ventricosum]|nr:hypothetical protein BHM03_00045508 [Ensete ventricosum]
MNPLSSLLLTICTSPRRPWSLRRGARLQLRDVDLAHLTCVRSVVRLLTPQCLCQAGFPVSGRPHWQASCPRARGRDSQVNICRIIPPPPEETFSRFPIRVLKMRSCAELSVCGEVILGINPGDLAEKVNSGANPGNLAERVNSGTNPKDLAERVNSGTNPGDLVERVNSGTNPGDLAEKVNSGTNPGDLVERVNSGTNPGDLAEKVNSGTNPGDLAERVNSGTNPGDLAEKVNSGTNPRDLAEKGSVGHESGSNLDTAVTEGSLAVIRGRYSIPTEYGLHVPRLGQRPYSSDMPDVCISVDALEVGLRLPLHPLIE